MSDIGVISGRYASIEELARLVDAAILALNTQKDPLNAPVLKELSMLLLDAGSRKPSNLRALRLATLLHDYPLKEIETVESLGRALVQNARDKSVKEGLDRIAALLEHERAQAADRLRYRP